MLQADKLVANPANGQNYNRYSYVLNNPLKYTDPSGWVAQQARPQGMRSAANFNPSTQVPMVEIDGILYEGAMALSALGFATDGLGRPKNGYSLQDARITTYQYYDGDSGELLATTSNPQQKFYFTSIMAGESTSDGSSPTNYEGSTGRYQMSGEYAFKENLFSTNVKADVSMYNSDLLPDFNNYRGDQSGGGWSNDLGLSATVGTSTSKSMFNLATGDKMSFSSFTGDTKGISKNTTLNVKMDRDGVVGMSLNLKSEQLGISAGMFISTRHDGVSGSLSFRGKGISFGKSTENGFSVGFSQSGPNGSTNSYTASFRPGMSTAIISAVAVIQPELIPFMVSRFAF
jgi:hypothetical protein